MRDRRRVALSAVLLGCSVRLDLGPAPSDAPSPRRLVVTQDLVCALSGAEEMRCAPRRAPRVSFGCGADGCAAVSGARAVVGGAGHWCALRRDGQVRCGGANDRGQLGIGSFAGARSAVVPGIASVVALGAGYHHTCVVTEEGSARATLCWGEAEYGALGVASARADPAPRTRPVALGAPVAARFAELVGGEAHACARTVEGAVWCWGRNARGQLGDGSRETRFEPVPILWGRRVLGLAAGAEHTCAIDDGAALWCWGRNDAGQLGDGSREDRAAPVRVEGLPPLRALVGGRHGTCAIDAADQLWCWGATQPSLAPARALPGVRVDAVGAFEDDVCASLVGSEHACCARGVAALGPCLSTDG